MIIEDTLLDTSQKREMAVSNFIDLLQHPGYILLRKMVDANIAILTEKIITGGQPEVEMDRLRDRLQINKDIINTPNNQVRELRIIDSPEESADPYEQHKKLDKDIE